MFSMMHAWQKCCKWTPISQHQTLLTCSDQLYMRHNWVSISCSSAERVIKLLANLSWLCELIFLCAWWSDIRYTAHDVVYSSSVSVRHGLSSQDWSTCHCSNQIVKNIVGWFGDFKIGGQIIHTVKYADDLVLLAKEEKVLQDMCIAHWTWNWGRS